MGLPAHRGRARANRRNRALGHAVPEEEQLVYEAWAGVPEGPRPRSRLAVGRCRRRGSVGQCLYFVLVNVIFTVGRIARAAKPSITVVLISTRGKIQARGNRGASFVPIFRQILLSPPALALSLRPCSCMGAPSGLRARVAGEPRHTQKSVVGRE